MRNFVLSTSAHGCGRRFSICPRVKTPRALIENREILNAPGFEQPGVSQPHQGTEEQVNHESDSRVVGSSQPGQQPGCSTYCDLLITKSSHHCIGGPFVDLWDYQIIVPDGITVFFGTTMIKSQVLARGNIFLAQMEQY